MKDETHIMARQLGRRVAQQRVLDRVGRADDLGVAVLALRRPHGQTGQEAAVAVFELDQRIGDIAPGIKLVLFKIAL